MPNEEEEAKGEDIRRKICGDNLNESVGKTKKPKQVHAVEGTQKCIVDGVKREREKCECVKSERQVTVQNDRGAKNY